MTWRCDETDRTPICGDPCFGWLEEGWPWHGCECDPDHDRPARVIVHQCPCGHRWETNHYKKGHA
jgi:hypothetical protein